MVLSVIGDFDFLLGSWTVANRRLVDRLVGCTEWQEFEATSRAWRLLDGAANIDEFRFPDGSTALTLRLFDPQQRQWSLRWATSSEGQLFPPVLGGFDGGVGTFYGDDSHQGTPVRVRYIWSEITATSARWEQAFAIAGGQADGDQDWETNWIMQLSRTAE